MEKVIQDLKQDLSERSIADCEAIYKFALENNLTNEQWFLDWQDKLNEISVR